jgi:Peptidase family S41
MPNFARLPAGPSLAMLGLFVSLQARAADDREALWRQDLKFMESEFAAHQLDFGKLYPRFHEEVVELQGEAGKLSDSEMVFRVMKMVSSANVGHNIVFLPARQLGFQPIPFMLAWYSDGLAVAAASADYAAAIGTHVVRIGSMTPEQVLAAVAPYIAHENDTALRDQSTRYMQMLNVLRQVGAADSSANVVFTLAKPGGEPFTLSVPPAEPGMKRISMFEALKIPLPLFRKQPDAFYWYEYLADSEALYIQYNRCKNDPKLAFKEFAKDLFAFADSHPVKRVVLDLRLNSGGDSRVLEPLKNGLKSRAKLRANVYVLIGPRTFSSAQMAAVEFRHDLHAKLVGEATGEKLNGYGEVRVLTLPNSGLKMQYSTKCFHLGKDDDSGLEPDVRVSSTLGDALAGRDPVLDAALRP